MYLTDTYINFPVIFLLAIIFLTWLIDQPLKNTKNKLTSIGLKILKINTEMLTMA